MAILKAKKFVLKANLSKKPVGKVPEATKIKRILENPLIKLKKLVPKLKSNGVLNPIEKFRNMLHIYENSHKEIDYLEKIISKTKFSSSEQKNSVIGYLSGMKENRVAFLKQFRDLKNHLDNSRNDVDSINISAMAFSIVDIPASAYLSKKKLIEYELSKLTTKTVMPHTASRADYRH